MCRRPIQITLSFFILSLLQSSRSVAYGTYGGMRSGYSSRSAVDVGASQRISVPPPQQQQQQNHQQQRYSTSRPSSYHERAYPTRREYDTMSLRSMRIGDGDDRYDQGGASQSVYYTRQMSSNSAAPIMQRSLSGNFGQEDGSSWVERAEVAQTRTIRAPAMRTLQRFQSNNRNRVASGSYGTLNSVAPQQLQQSAAAGSGYGTAVLEQTSRAPSVRSLAESSHQVQEIRGMDVFDGNKSLMSQHSFTSG